MNPRKTEAEGYLMVEEQIGSRGVALKARMLLSKGEDLGSGVFAVSLHSAVSSMFRGPRAEGSASPRTLYDRLIKAGSP